MVHRMSVQLDVPNTPHGRSVYGPVKAHGVPTVELPRPKSRKVAGIMFNGAMGDC